MVTNKIYFCCAQHIKLDTSEVSTKCATRPFDFESREQAAIKLTEMSTTQPIN
jgi:hypothetical protein